MADLVYDKLTQLLREVFKDDALVARPDLTADHVKGWDSFGYLNLIFAVEKAFGVRFAAPELGALRNVGELADLIVLKMQ